MAKEKLIEHTLDEMDETEMVPLQDVGLDLALGSGVQTNCIIEVYGSEASGKTTICFEAIDKFLERFPDKFAYYYNYERSIDKFYVRNLLKNNEDHIKRFKIVEPEFLEDGMEHLFQVMDSGIGSICVVDSLAAMTTKDENDKALDKAQVGGFKAKAMAEVCRKIGSRLGKGAQTTIVFINHVNPVLGGFSFIPQQVTPGGKAVKFWASLRLEVAVQERLTKEETIAGSNKKEKIPFGNCCKVKIEKNKFFPPYKRAICYIMFGQGLNRAMSLIDYGLQLGIIGMHGKTDYFLTGKESSTIRGKANFAKLINSRPEIFNYLYKTVSKFIEEKRREAKNINVDCISSSSTFQKGNDSLDETASEVEEMFTKYQIEGDSSLEDKEELDDI